MVGSLCLNLLIQVLVACFEIADLFIGQVDSSEDVWLTGTRLWWTSWNHSDFWRISVRALSAASASPHVRHILLLSQIIHRLWCKVWDFLRLLLLIVVDVLLHWVALSQHIQYFSLIDTLLDSISVRLPFDFHDLFALFVKHKLASIKGSFKFEFFLDSFAVLPFTLVH